MVPNFDIMNSSYQNFLRRDTKFQVNNIRKDAIIFQPNIKCKSQCIPKWLFHVPRATCLEPQTLDYMHKNAGFRTRSSLRPLDIATTLNYQEARSDGTPQAIQGRECPCFEYYSQLQSCNETDTWRAAKQIKKTYETKKLKISKRQQSVVITVGGRTQKILTWGLTSNSLGLSAADPAVSFWSCVRNLFGK
jgi:hypothetical protein